MVELLSEKFLNDRNNMLFKLVNKLTTLGALGERVSDLKERYSTDYYDKLLNQVEHLMDASKDLASLIWYYIWDEFPLIDLLNVGIKKEEEIKKLGDLIRNLDVSNENQTMAFHNISIDEIYNKTIVQVSNFTLHRRSKLINDLRSTSTLYYDIVLPFNDKNYDPTSTDCTSKWDLPTFF